MATVAVFLALGGGAYAALKLPSNSVGSQQLKRNAVTSSKVSNGSLQLGDFKVGQIPVGPAGARGATGATGGTGPPGDRGPSDVYRGTLDGCIAGTFGCEGATTARVTVPAGDYVVTAGGEIFNATLYVTTPPGTPPPDGAAICSLTAAIERSMAATFWPAAAAFARSCRSSFSLPAGPSGIFSSLAA